jgi:hypothetical protein
MSKVFCYEGFLILGCGYGLFVHTIPSLAPYQNMDIGNIDSLIAWTSLIAGNSLAAISAFLHVAARRTEVSSPKAAVNSDGLMGSFSSGVRRVN